MKRFIPPAIVLVTLFLLFVTACTTGQNNLIETEPIKGSATSTKIYVTASQIPSQTPTLPPTETPTNTATPPPTKTPTLIYPVSISTPFQMPASPITPVNAGKLMEIARYGVPILQAYQYTVDGKLYFEATSLGLRVYQVLDHKMVIELPYRIYPSSTHPLSVDGNGRRVAMITIEGVRVLTVGGKVLYEAPISFRRASQVYISPDGKTLVSSDCQGYDDNCVTTITQVDTGNLLKSIQTKSSVPGSSFSPNGGLLALWAAAGGNLQGLTLYRTTDWTVAANTAIPLQATNLVFSQDETVFASIDPTHISIQKTSNGQLVRQISNDLSAVWSDLTHTNQLWLAISQDGKLIGFTKQETAGGQIIQIRNITDGELVGEKQISAGSFIGYPDQDNLIELGRFNNFSENDLTATANIIQYKGATSGVDGNAIFLANKGLIVSSLNGWSICKYEWGKPADCNHDPMPTQQNPPAQFHYVTRSGDIFTLQEGGSASMLDTFHGFNINQPIQSIANRTDCNPGYISDSGKYLLCSDRYDAELYRLDTGKLVKQWNSRVASLAITDDEKYMVLTLAGESGDQLLVVSMGTSQILMSQNVSGGIKPFLSSNPNVVYFVIENHNSTETLMDFAVHKYDLETKKETVSPTITGLTEAESRSSSRRWVKSIAVTSDQALIGVGFNDGLVYLVDPITGNVAYKCYAHNDEITGLAFSKDGTMMATIGIDGYSRIWGVKP